MKIPITLIPQGRVPRDPNLGFQVRRLPAVESAAPTIAAATTTPPTLPPGSDSWYEVFARSCIPYRAYADVMCADTPNATFGGDDNFDSEDSISGGIVSESGQPTASAWWALTVPSDVPAAWLTADTWLTSGGEDATPYPSDTNLTILTPFDGAENGMHWPLSRERTDGDGTDPLDFSKLQLVFGGFSDDDPDPDDPARPYTSKVTDVALVGGKTYFIRVDCWNDSNKTQIYRLRLTLTETAP